VVIAIMSDRELWFPDVQSLFGLWFAAVVTAVASFGQYGRLRRKPWYVVLCLWVNGAGLAFTTFVAVLFLVMMMNR
jgi:hypothetical protein